MGQLHRLKTAPKPRPTSARVNVHIRLYKIKKYISRLCPVERLSNMTILSKVSLTGQF